MTSRPDSAAKNLRRFSDADYAQGLVAAERVRAAVEIRNSCRRVGMFWRRQRSSELQSVSESQPFLMTQRIQSNWSNLLTRRSIEPSVAVVIESLPIVTLSQRPKVTFLPVAPRNRPFRITTFRLSATKSVLMRVRVRRRLWRFLLHNGGCARFCGTVCAP